MRKKQTNSGDEFPGDLLVNLHTGHGVGLREQLEASLRAAIENGRLVPGVLLPPSRILAAHLGVSRTIVVDVFAGLRRMDISKHAREPEPE